MNIIGLTGLVKIELPTHTIKWCDGGFFVYASETYRSKDSIYGTIGNFESIEEGVGDIVPAIILNVIPPSTSSVADITQPGSQTSRVTFSIAEYDVESRLILSAETEFSGQLDQMIYTLGKQNRNLTMSVVSLMERVFEGNIGNSLDPTFHKSVWPGETGHDNATGLSVAVAWGTDNPNSNTVGTTGVLGFPSSKKKNKGGY